MIPDFGAHAFFIWLAYGVVLCGLMGLFLQGRVRLKYFEKRTAFLRDQIKAKRSPLKEQA